MNTTRVILTYREDEALPADGRRHEIHPERGLIPPRNAWRSPGELNRNVRVATAIVSPVWTRGP
jgi:hypothetical protein